MEKQAITQAIASRQAGGIIGIVVDRPAKVRKDFKSENIRKRSRYALQLASYARRAPVKDAVTSGERESPQTPLWVSSVEKINGLTFWKHANGTEYLALPVFGERVKSDWTENGEVVSVETIASKLLASETAKRQSKAEAESKGQTLFNAIKLENISSIS